MAIGKPPSMGIDNTVTTIHKNLAELNSQAMFHLHKRSQATFETVERSRQEIESLTKRIGDLTDTNGVLTRSLKRLEDQYDNFKQEIESK